MRHWTLSLVSVRVEMNSGEASRRARIIRWIRNTLYPSTPIAYQQS